MKARNIHFVLYWEPTDRYIVNTGLSGIQFDLDAFENIGSYGIDGKFAQK